MTDIILPRRKFLIGAASLLAAPAVIRVARLMPVRVVPVIEKRMFHRVKIDYDASALVSQLNRGSINLHVTPTEFESFKNTAYRDGATRMSWSRDDGCGGTEWRITPAYGTEWRILKCAEIVG